MLMSNQEQMPENLAELCSKWSKGLQECLDNAARISYMKSELPKLTGDLPLLEDIICSIVECKAYPDIHYAAMFDSEIILYRDPNRQFSLRMYLWDAGEYDPIHDHNSWGVIGPALGDLEVINYRREAESRQKNRARLVEYERKLVQPCDTYSVLPLNAGIHKTGNPNDQPIIQVGVYGEKLTRRNYVNTYDLATGKISPLFSPSVKKRIIAEKALTLIRHN